jgi:hypothetical protein
MTPDEIRQHCLRQLELGSSNVGFVLPGRWGKRNTRRIWPRGPQGQIVAELPGGGIYVMFEAQEVLDALEQVLEQIEQEG